MLHRLLARLIAAVHLAYAAFVVLGSLAVLLDARLLWVHLAAVAWAACTTILDMGCVLTDWEKAAWRRGGRDPYPEGFLARYVLGPAFGPNVSHRRHVQLGIAVVVLNLSAYLLLFARR